MGACVEVDCAVDVRGREIDLFVVVDGGARTGECYEGNNVASYPGVGCPPAVP